MGFEVNIRETTGFRTSSPKQPVQYKLILLLIINTIYIIYIIYTGCFKRVYNCSNGMYPQFSLDMCIRIHKYVNNLIDLRSHYIIFLHLVKLTEFNFVSIKVYLICY